ncbi:hypothetical protein Pelo_4836 [Pelomyxa schiedti]|nr:hypothetical protein Pelo_4836 [Pelomyxa schiedti]
MEDPGAQVKLWKQAHVKDKGTHVTILIPHLQYDSSGIKLLMYASEKCDDSATKRDERAPGTGITVGLNGSSCCVFCPSVLELSYASPQRAEGQQCEKQPYAGVVFLLVSEVWECIQLQAPPAPCFALLSFWSGAKLDLTSVVLGANHLGYPQSWA